MNLEQFLLDSIWNRHEHCGDCSYIEFSCAATKGTECPWFQQELSSFIEETFDPDEWAFFANFSSEDTEDSFPAFNCPEFYYSTPIALAIKDLYRQTNSLKEQS